MNKVTQKIVEKRTEANRAEQSIDQNKLLHLVFKSTITFSEITISLVLNKSDWFIHSASKVLIGCRNVTIPKAEYCSLINFISKNFQVKIFI